MVAHLPQSDRNKEREWLIAKRDRDVSMNRSETVYGRAVPVGAVSRLFLLLMARLPPTCPRTHSKDAQARPSEPGSDAPFLAF